MTGEGRGKAHETLMAITDGKDCQISVSLSTLCQMLDYPIEFQREKGDDMIELIRQCLLPHYSEGNTCK